MRVYVRQWSAHLRGLIFGYSSPRMLLNTGMLRDVVAGSATTRRILQEWPQGLPVQTWSYSYSRGQIGLVLRSVTRTSLDDADSPCDAAFVSIASDDHPPTIVEVL